MRRPVSLALLAVLGCATPPLVLGQAAAPKPTVRVATISIQPLLNGVPIDLDRSMKARRDLAWKIAERVWTPVGQSGSTVPAWMTWYEQEDLEPLFRDYLAERARSPRASAESSAATVVARHNVKDLEPLFRDYLAERARSPRATPESSAATVVARHNVKDLHRSLTAARLGKELRQFSFPAFKALQLHAKPGTGTIFYSPAYVTHLLANAERIAAYDSAAFTPPRPGIKTIQQQRVQATTTLPPNAYALSMDSEMPADALMIKVAWVPVEDGAVPYFTDGKNLAKGFRESATGNFDVARFPNSSDPFIYHIATPDDRSGAARLVVVVDEQGKRWALIAMHIASKVRRTWLWSTLMWLAPRAPWWEADRPAFFAEHETDPQPWLTWPLHQYGMAVASGFTERDPTPWAAYERVPEPNNIGPNADLHEMATSFKDLARAMKGRQWSANPYIEIGMSHTNCIGCHQGSPNEFLATSLTKQRSTNVGDFSFSIATNREMFVRVLKERRPSG